MKSKKTSGTASPKFSLAIIYGTKNVSKEINVLCDKLISDALEDMDIELRTSEEKNKFRNEFRLWVKIERHLEAIALENISEINRQPDVQLDIIKFGKLKRLKGNQADELNETKIKLEKLAKERTEGKLLLFLTEEKMTLFIREWIKAKKQLLDEVKNRKDQRKRAMGITIEEEISQGNKTKKDYKTADWFKVGLLFASGEMDELKKIYSKNGRYNGTQIANHLGNKSYKGYINETISNTNKGSDKNIYANQSKLLKIEVFCRNNNIPVVDDFLKHIKPE